MLGKVLKEFKQGDNIDLDVLSDALLELCINGSQQKTHEVIDMTVMSRKYKERKSK